MTLACWIYWVGPLKTEPLCYQVPDYLDVVKHPIDLQTIEDKLVSEVYTSPQQFVDDIALMLNNCELYNKVLHATIALSFCLLFCIYLLFICIYS